MLYDLSTFHFIQILLVLVGYYKHHNKFLGTNKNHRTSWSVEWVLVLRMNPTPWNQYIILVDAIKIPEPVHLVIACEAMNLSKFLLQSLLGQLKALSRSSVVKLWIVTHHNQLSVKTKNHLVNTHSKYNTTTSMNQKNLELISVPV